MSKSKYRKARLSLALTSALVGGLAVGNLAQAVELARDNLGDAALFQYYSAKGDWQTFFRLINTSDDAILLKLRFREAANSREVLDFEVAMSPFDAWTAWTDADPLGNGTPGIKTNDTSCIFPLVGTSPVAGGGFKVIDADTNLVGADFKDLAFTGDYDDNAGLDSLVRMGEGHLEVIGVAEYDCEGSDDDEARFCENVTHNPGTGKPENCQLAYNAIYGTGGGDVDNADGDDMPNVLATNAYMIQVSKGQGGGYDPDVLADCADRPLELELIATDTNPDLDSCDALPYYGSGRAENGFGIGPTALNQRLWDGSVGSVELTFYQVDWDDSGTFVPGVTRNVDRNGDGVCEDSRDERNIPENNVPQDVYDAAGTDGKMLTVGGSCDYQIVDNGGLEGDDLFTTSTRTDEQFDVARIKQKGQFEGDPDYPDNQTPVTGGVDAVSRQFMRTSVINEWAASENPESIIVDYFTQWVLTFPTKNYYVDLQTDPILGDDISPILVDLSSGNDAFAPFSEEFDDAENIGKSCEPFQMDMWNREERHAQFTSPVPQVIPALCYETNVLNFNERYTDKGLDSNFTVTVPELYFPTDHDGSVSERGWGELTFTGPGTDVGLFNRARNYYGLPVTGFMLTIYNTGSTDTSHSAINEHKYTRDYDGSPLPR